LAGAFASDPVMRWLIGSRADTRARLRILFENSLAREVAKPTHIVDVEDSGRAVALWHEVDDWKSPDAPVLRVLRSVFRIFRWRLPQAVRLISMIEAAHPEEPHRHLGFIGVDPAHQGSGFGGALLTSMTNECDDAGISAYLESSNPANDALYHRFGFESRGHIPLPKGAPPITAMWRGPR
jgi:ribosomal protein S18 acetylase RimI-like enzyme